ncbi:unnamed protein product [Closterium sp. NIES-53]
MDEEDKEEREQQLLLPDLGSSAQSPPPGPSRVWRPSTRSATSHCLADDAEEDKTDSDYRGYAVGTDDDEDEEDDDGESEEEEGDDDVDGVTDEETQPVTPPSKRPASKTTPASQRKGKAPAKEASPAPAKKRSHAPREKRMWSDCENAIFVAARWFTKDEFQPLKGKQGAQYWARILAHIKENPDWIRGDNALQKQWHNLMLLWKALRRGDGGSGNGSVAKPPWWPYMELYNKDTAAADPHAVNGGGAANVNVQAGMEVPTSTQPGTSTPTFTGALFLHVVISFVFG